MSNLEMKANLIARVVLGDEGRTRNKLDYFGSPMNHPRYRITSYINKYVNMTVTEEHKYSPDLISHDRYGTCDLWWVICRYNGIINPLDPVRGIVPGMVLKIPSLQDINSWLQAVNSSQLSVITSGAGQKKSLVTV